MERALPSLRLLVESVPWRPTRHAGIHWHPLDPAGESERSSRSVGPDGASAAGDDSAVLIRMDPGHGYPPHRHLGIEDVFVLQGGYRDEMGEHRAGSYVRYPAGSAHAPVATGDPGRPIGEENPSCILFAIARSGVENL